MTHAWYGTVDSFILLPWLLAAGVRQGHWNQNESLSDGPLRHFSVSLQSQETDRLLLFFTSSSHARTYMCTPGPRGSATIPRFRMFKRDDIRNLIKSIFNKISRQYQDFRSHVSDVYCVRLAEYSVWTESNHMYQKMGNS